MDHSNRGGIAARMCRVFYVFDLKNRILRVKETAAHFSLYFDPLLASSFLLEYLVVELGHTHFYLIYYTVEEYKRVEDWDD